MKNIVDAIEKGHWEQVVGPEVAYCNGPKAREQVVGPEVAYCNGPKARTEGARETKLHKCENLIGIHPSLTATTTTNTTTTMSKSTKNLSQNWYRKISFFGPFLDPKITSKIQRPKLPISGSGI